MAQQAIQGSSRSLDLVRAAVVRNSRRPSKTANFDQTAHDEEAVGTFADAVPKLGTCWAKSSSDVPERSARR